MKRVNVDAMLDELWAEDLLRWFAFFAVRQEKEKKQEEETRRNRAAGVADDDEVYHWGTPRDE